LKTQRTKIESSKDFSCNPAKPPFYYIQKQKKLMNIQLTQKQLCEILSRNLGTNVDSVEIVECKEDVKSGKVGEAFHVPYNPRELTPEQYGASEGYRLLDKDEIKYRVNPYKEIEAWDKNDNRWDVEFSGSSKANTYRTKLSREELAKLS